MSAEEKSQQAVEREHAAQLPFLKVIVAVIGLAVLMMSVALNLYLVEENAVLKESVSDYSKVRQRAIFYQECHQIMQRMIREMNHVGKKDREVSDILEKYKVPIEMYGLDRIAGVETGKGFD